ncbi:MAG: CBS domain-containing protein [Chloroflexota bacterium]|nr:MAG: CBS domain-containing protein [Chloroflexota bacterium]
MTKKYCISDCMKKRVIFGQPEMTVKSAARLMAENNIGTLPVVLKGSELVGVTTMDNIIQIFLPDFVSLLSNISFVKEFGDLGTISPETMQKAESLSVADIMEEPISVDNDCELIRALSFMHKYKIQDIPVVEKGKLVGIASRVDIGRAFLSNWLNSANR